LQGFCDTFKNTAKVLQHIAVPEAQDTKALATQPCIAFRVVRGFIRRVLPTIDLDDEPRFEANEIDNVRTNGKLASKRQALKTMGAQPLPNFCLRLRHVLPKRARA
jgi:hypothetical protein